MINKKFILIIVLIIILIILAFILTFNFNKKPVLGGDKDSHGCIGSAGYSWNETKQKCVREWEEKNKNYCYENYKTGQICISLYDPVCGYSKTGEKKEYSNSCNACLNSEVEYWIKGECQ